MKRLAVFSITLFFSMSSFSATENFELLSHAITLKSKSKKDLKALVSKINNNKEAFFKGLEDKCLYQDEKTEICREVIQYAFETKLKLKAVSSEAKKKYRPSFTKDSVEANKTSLINAISIIEDSKKGQEKPFQMNFKGQLFQSKDSAKSLHVSSPLLPSLSFIQLEQYEGWAITQSSDVAGGSLLTKGKKVLRSDFLKIVLLAKPSFSGARLYGWSEALMLGGKKLLKKLEKNKNYKDQWSYIYFDQDANLVCSQNLKCNLSNKKNRSAKVGW